MRVYRWFRALALLAALGAAFAGAGACAAAPLKVLMVLVGGGPHDVEKNPPYLEKALKAAGAEVTKLAPPEGQQGNGAHLAKLADLNPGQCDVLVFYTVGQSLNPEQESALR